MLRKSFVMSVPIIFVIASAFNFMYEGAGYSMFVGFIAPVDDSVFEHTKLVFMPVILWWLFCYFENVDILNKNRWFAASLVSVISSMVSTVVLTCAYTFVFSERYLLAGIIILLISLITGQFLGVYFYDKRIYIKLRFIILTYLLLLLFFVSISMIKLFS